MKRVAGAPVAEARIAEAGAAETRYTARPRHDSIAQRSPRPAAQRGMTLIEVVVAVALLGMLSAGLFTALQIGATSWRRTRDALMLDRRVATANAIFHSSFASIVPVEAEVPPGRAAGVRSFPFFQGEPRAMRFVTSYSLTAGARGGLHITELQVTTAPQGLRILLNQLPYGGPLSVGRFLVYRVTAPGARGGRFVFQPIRALATSLIISDELSQCEFSYLRRSRRLGEEAVWLPYWDERDSLPGAIRVSLTPQTLEARVLPVSITTPVRAERSLLNLAAPQLGAR